QHGHTQVSVRLVAGPDCLTGMTADSAPWCDDPAPARQAAFEQYLESGKAADPETAAVPAPPGTTVSKSRGSVTPTLLELREVSKVYGAGPAQVNALRRVNLSVRGGELVAVMGPSGSGKSSLLTI